MMHHCDGGDGVSSSRQIESAADGKTRKEGGKRKNGEEERRTSGKNVNWPSAAAPHRTFAPLRRLLLARTSFREAMETNHVWDRRGISFLGRGTDSLFPLSLHVFGEATISRPVPDIGDRECGLRASVALFTSHNSSHAHPVTS